MILPKEWNIEQVGDLFDVQLGKMLNKAAKEKHPQLPYLGNSNVKWGSFDLNELKTMHFSEKDIAKFSLELGDIIMCEGGEVGRCAIWTENRRNIFYQKALHRLRSKGKVIPVFFQNYMQHIAGTKLLDDYTTRTSIAHLTREKLVTLPVRLPPLPEQKKIAQILSTWDQAITTTEQLLANSRQQKKALMQQLLTGKQRLLDKDGERFSGEWKKVKLGSVANMNSGGTPKSTIGEYYGGDIPWVSISDMTKQGKWIASTEKYLTTHGLENSTARIYPKNSVLYAMYASIGECSIAQVPLSSSQAILGIRPKAELDFEFLYFFLTSLKERIKLQGQQGTQSNLNARMVKDFLLYLPCIEEQQKIAAVLSTADREIDILQQKLDALRQEKKALMQQLLTGKRRVITEQPEA